MRSVRKISYLLFSLSIIAPTLFALDGKIKKASFIAHWTHQSQFAGYYVAREKGFYLNRDIDLTILEGGPRNPSESAMENGTADFASFWLSNAIKLRVKGVPIINIAQLIHRSALLLVTKKTSGITSPKDMDQKKIGVWDESFQIPLIEFLEQYNLNARIVYQPYSINLFLRDGVDITAAMWYNEYNVIINSGLNENELNMFFLADHNLNFPEDGIYCRASLLENDPKLCRAFVDATLEGWMYAFQHQEEAIEIVIKYSKEANISVNRTHQRWMLGRMKDLLLPEGYTQIPTSLSETDYQLVADKLFENKVISKKPTFQDISKPVLTQGSYAK